MDTEQNERLQEEEHEIVRLWEARNTVLSRLESSKKSISSPIDDNISISEVESRMMKMNQLYHNKLIIQK